MLIFIITTAVVDFAVWKNKVKLLSNKTTLS